MGDRHRQLRRLGIFEEMAGVVFAAVSERCEVRYHGALRRWNCRQGAPMLRAVRKVSVLLCTRVPNARAFCVYRRRRAESPSLVVGPRQRSLLLLRVAQRVGVIRRRQIRSEHFPQRFTLVAQRLHLCQDVSTTGVHGIRSCFTSRPCPGISVVFGPASFGNQVGGVEHALQRTAIGLVGEGVAEVPVEVLDVDDVGLAEADDGVAGKGGHHRDEVDGLAVHVEGDGRGSPGLSGL